MDTNETNISKVHKRMVESTEGKRLASVPGKSSEGQSMGGRENIMKVSVYDTSHYSHSLSPSLRRTFTTRAKIGRLIILIVHHSERRSP